MLTNHPPAAGWCYAGPDMELRNLTEHRYREKTAPCGEPDPSKRAAAQEPKPNVSCVWAGDRARQGKDFLAR